MNTIFQSDTLNGCNCNVPALNGEEITAQSKPNYDAWGWDSYWKCDEWLSWHKALKKAYGQKKANDIWIQAWNKQDIFEHAYNWCKYSASWVAYFDKQGLDMSHAIARLVTRGANTVVNVVDNAGETAEKTTKNLGRVVKVLPYAAVGVLGIIFYPEIKALVKGVKGAKNKVVNSKQLKAVKIK